MRFQRQRTPWTPDKWDDGYIDNKGRFRVYRPDYPGAYALGYALRAHVVWWLATGDVCRASGGRELHHRDGNRLNDAIGNLTRISRSDHQLAHKCAAVLRTCLGCGNKFAIEQHRLRESGRGRFCSQRCYQASKIGRPRRDRRLLATHCVNGHEWTPENTLRYGKKRTCRECNRIRCREYGKRRRAA